MSVQIIQFGTEPHRVGEVEEAIRNLFAAVEAAAPAGIEYTAARIGDSAQFLLTLTLPDDAANPLLEIPEADEFRGKVGQWAGAPVPPFTLHFIGRYTA
ncbi:hypothetical protein Z045_24935 [Rhodococcus pyridinivorans KG-16]|uniref:ABM domain-containing protein n=1 Tax=Rhodococcus pyridinivorans KG-16 TaxID=1441730 RepID=A0A0V9UDB0_9NOCA|nr:hypothetical protein [Rhodococcus pyridinivorans]KSZ56106.1 hypothetical protein Z045_24935 [Rhodococcus pyridinivorans KG-16]